MAARASSDGRTLPSTRSRGRSRRAPVQSSVAPTSASLSADGALAAEAAEVELAADVQPVSQQRVAVGRCQLDPTGWPARTGRKANCRRTRTRRGRAQVDHLCRRQQARSVPSAVRGQSTEARYSTTVAFGSGSCVGGSPSSSSRLPRPDAVGDHARPASMMPRHRRQPALRAVRRIGSANARVVGALDAGVGEHEVATIRAPESSTRPCGERQARHTDVPACVQAARRRTRQ